MSPTCNRVCTAGGDTDVFSVDASTGRLYTSQTLNRNNKLYIVTVHATDKLNNTAECQV